MSSSHLASGAETKPRQAFARASVFMLVAITGLLYVKWAPYWHKAFVAATHHAIGPSILTGSASAPPAPSWSAALSYAWTYGLAIWQALLLALVLGSAVEVLLPARWITRWLGKAGFGGVATGGLLGIPGMMCTCCTAPVVVGLRQAQASIGAAVAFWLGNPLLNPATIVFAGLVLGWHWALFRVAAAVPMVFGLAWASRRFAPEALPLPERCEQPSESTPIARRWARSFARLAIALVPEYLIIVLLLGAARAWLFPVVTPGVGNSPAWILGMAVAGTLFVIPTAGEIPIVQGMQALGLGAGPAAALLLTLPAISLPSLWMVRRVFPRRVLAFLTLAVMACGVLAGMAAIALGP